VENQQQAMQQTIPVEQLTPEMDVVTLDSAWSGSYISLTVKHPEDIMRLKRYESVM
jgi:hypothetical protein